MKVEKKKKKNWKIKENAHHTLDILGGGLVEAYTFARNTMSAY